MAIALHMFFLAEEMRHVPELRRSTFGPLPGECSGIEKEWTWASLRLLSVLIRVPPATARPSRRLQDAGLWVYSIVSDSPLKHSRTRFMACAT